MRVALSSGFDNLLKFIVKRNSQPKHTFHRKSTGNVRKRRKSNKKPENMIKNEKNARTIKIHQIYFHIGIGI